ncbi:hypothetical protein [Flaviaesturariibacter terrae]
MIAQTNTTTLLSTVLFVDGNPVRYQISRNGDTVHLRPDALMNLQADLPDIVARRSGSTWKLQPAIDRDLAAQVLEDLGRLFEE